MSREETPVRTTALMLLVFVLMACACSRPAAPPNPTAIPRPVVLVAAEEPPPRPVVRVTAKYPGANAKMVADTVAVVIEHQVNGVEGAELLESESLDDGTYSLIVRFKPKTDMHAATILVQNRLNVAEPHLPEEVRRQGVTVDTNDAEQFPLLWVAITSPDSTYDAFYLNNYAALRVRDELARVPGVTGVHAVGRVETAIRFHANADKLAARGLTITDLVAAIQRQNLQVAAGQLGSPPIPTGAAIPLALTVAGRLADIEQLNNIIVRTTSGGQVVYLRDIGTIEPATKADGSAQMNGRVAALLAIHTQGENASADGVRKVIAQLEKTNPKGLTVQLIGDPSASRFAVVDLRLPDAAVIARTVEAAERAETRLRGLPGVAECLSFVDREPNVATVLVKLLSKDTPTPQDLRKALADIREAAVRVSVLSAGRPFPIRIALTDTGDHSAEKLREWADAVSRRLAADGIVDDPAVYPGGAKPQLFLDIDREKAQKLGVRIDDILTTFQANMGAVYVSDFNKFGRTFQIRVEMTGTGRKPQDLQRLQVRNRDGAIVALGTFAAVRESLAPLAVLRVNLHPALRITAAPPEGKALADVVAKCIEAAEVERKGMKLPDTFQVVNITDPKPR